MPHGSVLLGDPATRRRNVRILLLTTKESMSRTTKTVAREDPLPLLTTDENPRLMMEPVARATALCVLCVLCGENIPLLNVRRTMESNARAVALWVL